MEIVALLGMPKIQEAANRNNNFLSFAITPDNTADVSGANYAGAPFDCNKAANTSGWIDISWRLQFQYGISALGPNANRVVFGFRVVMSKGYRGDSQQCSRMNFGAIMVGSGSFVQSTVPSAINPSITGPEGQYFEIVFDYSTSFFEIYIDGTYFSKGSFFNNPTPMRKDHLFFVDMGADQWNSDRTNQEFRGLVRDLYMGSLAPGEVFEPLGDLVVDQLLTQSLSYDNGVSLTPTKVDQWNQSTYLTLDTAGVAEQTATFTDPTPLKSAIAITALSPSIAPVTVGARIWMEAQSGGVKIADELPWGPDRSTSYTSRFMKIDPSKIGSDLKIAFKMAES